MKWEHLTIASCFLTLLVARVVLLSPRHEINASSILAFRPGDDSNQSLPFAVLAAGDDPPAIQRSETWQKYTCRGQKLWQAMTNKKDKAVDYLTPIDTLFDGTLEEELERWGYIERNDDADDLCMFDTYLRQPLEALDIDPKGSVFGGPNECFFFQHYDPNMQDEDGFLVPSYNQEYEVDGKTYRATQAKAIIGANAESGVVYFLDVVSAAEGAKKAWGLNTNPPADQLPELRRISDMAWGIWRRVHSDGEDLHNINTFLVHDIRNDITKQLIAEALRSYKVPDGQRRATTVPTWPGLTFDTNTEEGAALLGSPNGIAAGYFLAQHKVQLGGNKYTSRVQIWVEWAGYDPCMIFHVNDAP